MANETRKFKITISILLAVMILWTAFLSITLFYHHASANSQWENEFFHMYICGVPVTRKNASDILGDGTVSYDHINNMLMLSNARLEYDGTAVILTEKDLTISLNGENQIIPTNPDAPVGIYASDLLLRKDVAFIGAGTLSIQCDGENNAFAAGIAADDVLAYSNISIDLDNVAEDSAGLECSYICLLGENTVSIRVNSVGNSYGMYVRGDVDLMENTTLDVVNTNAGKNIRGIECSGSFAAGEGSTISSTAEENGAGILCHGLFVDSGATVNAEIDAIGGIRYEE